MWCCRPGMSEKRTSTWRAPFSLAYCRTSFGVIVAPEAQTSVYSVVGASACFAFSLTDSPDTRGQVVQSRPQFAVVKPETANKVSSCLDESKALDNGQRFSGLGQAGSLRNAAEHELFGCT